MIFPSGAGLVQIEEVLRQAVELGGVTTIVRWPFGILPSNAVVRFETSSDERLRLGAAGIVERDASAFEPAQGAVEVQLGRGVTGRRL